MHGATQLPCDLQSSRTPDLLQHTPLLADNDALLAVSFHPDNGIDRDTTVFLEVTLYLNRQAVG